MRKEGEGGEQWNGIDTGGSSVKGSEGKGGRGEQFRPRRPFGSSGTHKALLMPHRVLRTQPDLAPLVLTPYRILRIQPERQQVVTPHRASLNRNSNEFSFHPTTSIHSIRDYPPYRVLRTQPALTPYGCSGLIDPFGVNRSDNKLSLRLRVVRVLTRSALIQLKSAKSALATFVARIDNKLSLVPRIRSHLLQGGRGGGGRTAFQVGPVPWIISPHPYMHTNCNTIVHWTVA